MATGYTCNVEDGKVTKLSDFVMLCARAFGACIDMKEAPLDKPIPQKFEAKTEHHDKGIVEAQKELAEVRAWTPKEACQKAKESYEKCLAGYKTCNAKATLTLQRYEAMLAKVRAWKVPGKNFRGLKKFMIGQLEESIKFDCRLSTKPKRVSGKKFKQDALERAEWSLNYHKKGRREELSRARQCSNWVQTLRANLAKISEENQ